MATMQSSAFAAGSKQQLAHEHALLETELAQFLQKRFLTPEEEVAETELKKRKLQLKDAMRSL